MAARTPSPSGTLADGKMIEAKSEDRSEDANEVAKQDVEAMMPKVEPARPCDENGSEPREDDNRQEVDRGRGSLAADSCYDLVVLGKVSGDS